MIIRLKKYYIKTFGCAANEADSERLAAMMEKQGYRLAKRPEEADTIIINTCSVRESAENRVFGLVNNLVKGQKNKPKIILTGCMVGSAKGKRRRYTLRQLELKLPQVSEFKTFKELISQEKISPKYKGRTSTLVPIMEGCNHFCSYCVVPYARGQEVSRPFNEVVDEVKQLAKNSCQEITLIGQNVNSYGKDRKGISPAPFARLLKTIHKIKGIKKISFLTSNPWDLTDEIIEAMAMPKIDRYLHLPVQSGDDQILKKMNRPYTAIQYLRLVEKIRKEIPDIRIGTDIIVGFPGETKKAFGNTVRLCKKVGFVKAYIAKYSLRPGTAAAKLKDNVPPAEKKRRWQVLDRLINK
jgi:tRNA-2-methylthio-N6-dimethylallyladenosine synthase